MKLLNLSKRSIIAIHVCLYLAASEEKYCTRAQLSKILGVSQAHLTAVLFFLVHSGIIKTHRGPNGGISLAKPTGKITMKDVYVAVEGGLELTNCLLECKQCPLGGCVLGNFINETNGNFVRIMGTTLEQAMQAAKNGKQNIKKTAR